MTTPSIPDLIAALEEHDGAMSDSYFDAAIAWFGTHRGALAEALRTLARERDELAAWNQYAAGENLAFNVRAAKEIGEARKERDEAKREAELLRALLGEANAAIITAANQLGDEHNGALLAMYRVIGDVLNGDLARGKDGAR